MKILIAGCGFSGAVIARKLAENGHDVLIAEERNHVGGNCHTERDPDTGVMLHVYGPHIFHTDNETVWDYVQSFGEMVPFVNRVKAVSSGQVYSLPINLHTINQFFGKAFLPEEAERYIQSVAEPGIETPANFEEQARKMIGEDLYRAFFHGYTRKQWGVEPSQLPASVLKRLPVRFTYNDNYYSHKYQAIPRNGYTDIIEKIRDIRGVEVRLNTTSESVTETFDHLVYTGPIDRYFSYRLGRLGYRTLFFERFVVEGDYQGTAVMNYCDEDVAYTRITEHKHFAPWEAHSFSSSVCFREYSSNCGPGEIPYYPIRLVDDKHLLEEYVALANKQTNVTFAGRLGTYSYLDMDETIRRALETGEYMLQCWKLDQIPPAFVHKPL